MGQGEVMWATPKALHIVSYCILQYLIGELSQFSKQLRPELSVAVLLNDSTLR
jgi:hypothetical protein